MQQGATKGRNAIDAAASTADVFVLLLTFVAFFMLSSAYFVIVYAYENAEADATMLEFLGGAFGALTGGLFVFVALLLVGMFVVRIQRQTMLGNSLQVEYSDYSWLRDWANVVAADLQMPRVEVFITQDPYINAYAFGFAKPYCIVLHSGSIRYLTQDELRVVVVHEMAHIKYWHTHAAVYLQPFLMIPAISILTGWLAGFWQRRAELTADRLALAYLGDSELVKSSLIKVHVGPDVASAMNQTARDWLQYTAERPMNRFAQTFSSHPFLVRRLSHVDRWKHKIEQLQRAGR